MRAMPLTRRSFMHAFGLGSVGALAVDPAMLLAARGREALTGLAPRERDAASALAADATAIRLNSNENPLGPGEKALAAIRGAFSEANRYPFAPESAVQAAIARAHNVTADHVLVGCGSGEILRTAVSAYVAPARPLVAGSPTFEDPADYARALGLPVIDVPVDRQLRLDLDAMGGRAKGAGLVFFCNPNNPTATVHGAAAVAGFAAHLNRTSRDTTILVDEAYHEYVDDPDYRTAVPLALDNPRVIVSRTFSKVFGMAGLRIGYAVARPETLAPLRRFKLGAGVNVLAAAAAIAGLEDADHVAAERARNRDVRQFTRDALARLGYPSAASQTNFLMVDVRRSIQGVIDGCRREGVLIGRPFPPLTTYARISVGTMAEMQRAVDVLGRVLARGTGQG
jgi:histidinol-phosphate aminotransferase